MNDHRHAGGEQCFQIAARLGLTRLCGKSQAIAPQQEAEVSHLIRELKAGLRPRRRPGSGLLRQQLEAQKEQLRRNAAQPEQEQREIWPKPRKQPVFASGQAGD